MAFLSSSEAVAGTGSSLAHGLLFPGVGHSELLSGVDIHAQQNSGALFLQEKVSNAVHSDAASLLPVSVVYMAALSRGCVHRWMGICVVGPRAGGPLGSDSFALTRVAHRSPPLVGSGEEKFLGSVDRWSLGGNEVSRDSWKQRCLACACMCV